MSRCVSAGGSRLLRGNLAGSVRVAPSSQTLSPPVFFERGGRGGVSNWCFLLHHQGAKKRPAKQGAYSTSELKTEDDTRDSHQSEPSRSLKRFSHISAIDKLASTACHISHVSPTCTNAPASNTRRRRRALDAARGPGDLRWGMKFRALANVRRLMTGRTRVRRAASVFPSHFIRRL